ncbi:MAG: hypothetical protein ACXVWZ_00965 [Nocardioides sp.]
MRDAVLGALAGVPFVLGATTGQVHHGQAEFTVADPAVVESSGLVVQDGLYLTTNDSGDSGRVFALDPRTGRTVGVTHWSADPVDTEALAPAGHGEVWVGDIGDNNEDRPSVSVTRVPVGRGERTVSEPSYELVYPHGSHNAETLLCDPRTGRLYVATKDVFGGELYRAPRTLSAAHPNRLRPVAPVLPIATDGSFFPDGRHVVVRDYSRAVVYTFPGMEPVGDLTLPVQDQGEGIAVAPDGSLHVSSEGEHEPVLRVDLPRAVRRALAPSAPDETTPPVLPPTGTTVTGRPADAPAPRPAWPWLLTGGLGLAALTVLLRSVRPR